MFFSCFSLCATGIFATLISCVVAAPVGTSQDDLPYFFTLAALNLTLPNANTTGAPLVLGQGGAIEGAEFEVTSTYASFPYNEFPALSLQSTSLYAFALGGLPHTNATAPTSGGTLGWLTTNAPAPSAATGFTAVADSGASFSQLAFNSHADLWSLCPFTGGQVNVVFNVSADIPPPSSLQFNPSDCYSVNLNIVPIQQA